MSVLNIISNAIESIETYLEDLPKVNAEMLGLDPSAGNVWVDTKNESIISEKRTTRTLDYYGGFEYIDDEYRKEIGDYTVYTVGNNRVESALDIYDSKVEETEMA